MDFFIKEDNVRPGNRGGRDQFKWDNIRLLNNKDRESYLGVTQSIGFLDKGGKWRKRDWWLSLDPNEKVHSDLMKKEIESIKKEEERLMRETLFPGMKDKLVNNTKAAPNTNLNENNQKAKLTDYEWKELMKKEANFAPDDSKLFEFYENDDKRAGIGMKPTVSFRTNPYGEADHLTRLEGINVNENNENPEKANDEVVEVEEDMKDNPYLRDNKNKVSQGNNTLVKKYINAYMKDKKEREEQTKTDKKEKTKEKEKPSHKRERSRSRSITKDKKHKKEKKEKRHRSRSHHKHHKK